MKHFVDDIELALVFFYRRISTFFYRRLSTSW